MSESMYRRWMLILFAVFVIGALVFGYQIAENGRYVQYDSSRESYDVDKGYDEFEVMDTRTGVVTERRAR